MSWFLFLHTDKAIPLGMDGENHLESFDIFKKKTASFMIGIGLFCLIDSCFSEYTTIEKMLVVVKLFCVCHKDRSLSLYTRQNSRLSTKDAACCLHRLGVMVASWCKLIRWTTALMVRWWWSWGWLCRNENWGAGDIPILSTLFYWEQRPTLFLKKKK